jgi:nucleoside diphosphate kinase
LGHCNNNTSDVLTTILAECIKFSHSAINNTVTSGKTLVDAVRLIMGKTTKKYQSKDGEITADTDVGVHQTGIAKSTKTGAIKPPKKGNNNGQTEGK